MPTDETYVHAIDAIQGYGPVWLLVAGVLVLAGVVAWRVVPLWDKHRTREMDIAQQREERKHAEIVERTQADVRAAESGARMADAVQCVAESQRAVATALDVVSAKFDASAVRSSHRGEQVDTIAHQVEDIHAVTVKGR